VNKMCFADGEELETDIVLFSAGIRPRDDIAVIAPSTWVRAAAL